MNTIGKIVIAAGAGLLTGALLASAVGSGGGAPDAAPAATVTATATATVKALSTVTAEPVTVTEVPAACVGALDEADRLIDITTRMAGYVEQHLLDEGDVWYALADGDYSVVPGYTEAMLAFTDNIAGLTHEVGTLRYAENSAACRAHQR